MNRGSSAASCPPSGDGHGSGHGHSDCRRVCSNCRKVVLRQEQEQPSPPGVMGARTGAEILRLRRAREENECFGSPSCYDAARHSGGEEPSQRQPQDQRAGAGWGARGDAFDQHRPRDPAEAARGWRGVAAKVTLQTPSYAALQIWLADPDETITLLSIVLFCLPSASMFLCQHVSLPWLLLERCSLQDWDLLSWNTCTKLSLEDSNWSPVSTCSKFSLELNPDA